MQKRGAYFFVIDVFIGAAIIFFTLATILSGGTHAMISETAENTARDYLSFMSNTKLIDFDNDYRIKLSEEGKFDDEKKTILQGIANLYSEGDFVNAKAFLNNFTHQLIQPQQGFEFRLNDTTLLTIRNNTRTKAVTMSVARQIVFSTKDEELLGPWIAEVKVWS